MISNCLGLKMWQWGETLIQSFNFLPQDVKALERFKDLGGISWVTYLLMTNCTLFMIAPGSLGPLNEWILPNYLS